MRRFVIIGQSADAGGAFSLEDIAGTSGRIDVLVRCVRAALCVSHGLRTDVVVDLVLLGGPRAPRTLRIDGSRARFIRPDERSLATLVKKALTAEVSGPAFVEVRPGVSVRDAGLSALLAELDEDAVAYVLDESAPDLREASIGTNVAFFVGDHRGLDDTARSALSAIGARAASVGPTSVHADDAVTLAMNEIDRAHAGARAVTATIEDPFRLSDEVVEAVAALRPITATFWGVPGHEAEWDDMSPEGHERVRARLEGFVARVPTASSRRDRWERLALSVLQDFLRLELERYAHEDHLGDLNNIASPFQLIRMAFDVMDASTEAGWRARVARLETLDRALDGYRLSLARGLDTGRAVAARQVRAVIEQGRVLAGERSFVHDLGGAMTAAGVTDPTLQRRLASAVPRACTLFGGFASWLEDVYLPRARQTDGVGRTRYVREAKRFLGMEIDPDDTYAWGWREISSISERMRTLAGEIAPGKSIAGVLDLLKTDPAHGAKDIDAFLSLMRTRQQQALDQLAGSQFDVPQQVRTLEVKLAPPGGPLGAYYVPPSDGFARPGSVWYAPGSGRSFPLFDQIATAYHEGFPGHHLQIGIQVALTDRLSRLHRVADGYSGYAEGWALYAEELMAELGYYETPEYLFGMLSSQMARACRVVIDIGSHLSLPIPTSQPFHPGETWTFELGVEMLGSMAGLTIERSTSEMTRYLGWPGQAISYKVGQRVFLELRDAERRRLGSAFDPKDFHARILGCGNVGLDHLRTLVLPEADAPSDHS